MKVNFYTTNYNTGVAFGQINARRIGGEIMDSMGHKMKEITADTDVNALFRNPFHEDIGFSTRMPHKQSEINRINREHYIDYIIGEDSESDAADFIERLTY